MTSCRDFRQQLERALSSAGRPRWSALSWHRHLITCAACRDLLAAEEVLELLLDSLPDPALPPALCQRVLLRLRTERNDEALERLLALDDRVDAPAELSSHVLAGLSSIRASADDDAELDALLARVPEPVPPSDLADRVLDGLEGARSGSPRPRRRVDRWIAAALFVFGLGAASWILRSGGAPFGFDVVRFDPAALAETPANQLPTEFLADFEVLDRMKLLQSEDELVQLGTEVAQEAVAGTDELVDWSERVRGEAR